MYRMTLIGASIAALAAAGASAQETAAETPQYKAPTETAAETAKVLSPAQVSTEEDARLYAQAEFQQADVNQDMVIDKGEFIAYAEARTPAITPVDKTMAKPKAADKGAKMKGAEPMQEAAATAEAQYAELAKGDTISQTELIEKRVEQFAEADADKNDKLDTREREKFAALVQPANGEDGSPSL